MSLSHREVRDLIASYGSLRGAAEITEELLTFGTSLLQEQLGRTEQIQSKATLILGYAIGTAGFLLIGKPDWIQWKTHFFLSGLYIIALVDAFSTAALAMAVLRVKRWNWFSDKIWFPAGIQDAEHLRQHHLRSMHILNADMGAKNKKMAELIDYAQWLAALGGSFMLAAALLKLFV